MMAEMGRNAEERVMMAAGEDEEDEDEAGAT